MLAFIRKPAVLLTVLALIAGGVTLYTLKHQSQAKAEALAKKPPPASPYAAIANGKAEAVRDKPLMYMGVDAQYFSAVLLPEVEIAGRADELTVKARVEWTFPLRVAQIVWGDGAATHWESVSLENTGEFASASYQWRVPAKGWKWARLAVWDAAGNGAFTQPTRAQ